MPTFATPNPITASVEIVSGAVHVVATDRDDTVVTVSPQDPNRASDVRIADAARVDFANGTLTVSAGRRFIAWAAAAPSSSTSNCRRAHASRCRRCPREVRADGDFGDCRFSTVERGCQRGLRLRGNIKADSASGGVTIETVVGAAVMSTASGNGTVGDLTGDVKFRAASGSLSVRRLHGTVNAQTASGDVAVAAAVTGGVSVQTGSGDIEVGVEEGTAARLDLRTHSGSVRNDLAAGRRACRR